MLDLLENDLKKSLVTTKVLTSNFKFIDEASKKSHAYNDNLYIPFYYHIGKYLKPTTMLEVGVDLGFISSCFFKSCKTVDYYLGFQSKKEEVNWDKSLYLSNIKKNYKKQLDVYYGDFLDKSFLDIVENKKFDIAIININDSFDKLFALCDFIFLNLNKDGYMIFDFIKNNKSREIFFNIANGYKKEYKVFETRNGTGVLKK